LTHYRSMSHVTLNTGHTRHSPRSEVADHVLAEIGQWLGRAIALDRPVSIPAPMLAHFSATPLPVHGGVIYALAARQGWTPLRPDSPKACRCR
jgi:hypothetical protein